MFPTKFAIGVARKHNLYISDNPKRLSPNHKDYDRGVELHLCLEEFQKFALTSELEDANVAYIGMDKPLTVKQITGLVKIYKYTRIWVKGQVVEDLLVNMDSDPKAMAAIASLVLDVASGEDVSAEKESEFKMIIKLAGGKLNDKNSKNIE